jgi:phosphoserine phosphatase
LRSLYYYFMPQVYSISNTGKKIPDELHGKINSLPIAGKPYAAFDLDNTLLIGDIGEAVFALLARKKLIKNFGWKDYLSLIEKNKLKAYKRIIDVMQGLQLGILEEVTLEVLNKKAAISIEGYKIAIPKRSEMMRLILEMLAEKGISIYVITASNEVSAAIICKKYFGIPASHIIGAEVSIDKKGIIQAGEKEFPYAKGKVNILKKRFKNKPLVTGGDSPGDKYLINYTAKGGISLWLGKAVESL